MNIRTKTKTRIAFFGIYGMLVLSALGSMVGTYAWYQYSARAGMTYHGTVVNDSGTMSVGLFSAVNLPDATAVGLEEDKNVHNLYWSTNSIGYEAISYFMRMNGYATNKIAPVTSSYFEIGSAFALRQNPTPNTPYNPYSFANRGTYCYLPLVFKTGGVRPSVMLTDLQLSSNGNLDAGVRMYIDAGEECFIFNPSSDNDGFTIVGGVLDLTTDGYFDYDSSDKKEFVYGEYESISYLSTPSGYDEPLPESERTSFNGKHAEGTYAVDEENSIFKSAHYLGKNSVLNNKILGYSFHGYTRIDFTIYLEGWDHSIVDQEVGNYFNLDLDFAGA